MKSLSEEAFARVRSYLKYFLDLPILNMSHSTTSRYDENSIDEITSSVERKLQDLAVLSDECSIYRVPHRIRKVNEKAFTPQVISIGPLHHGKEELNPMEDHKRRYLCYFLQLTKNAVSLREYIKFIKDRETRLRNCYAEIIQLGSKQFVEMVLTDAAFLILFLVKISIPLPFKIGDRMFGKPMMIFDIRDDLFLLENQLPFFILEELFELSKLPDHLHRSYMVSETSVLRDTVDLVKLTYFFLENWFQIPLDFNKKKSYTFRVENLLQFLNTTLGYHRQRAKVDFIMPSAVELHLTGVRIKPAVSKNLFEIEFKDGILQIPPLKICDSAETLLQNLCAFEQIHCMASTSWYNTTHSSSEDEERGCVFGLFSDYAAFMSQLVKDKKDVELLVQNGVIIDHALGSSERVLGFFHNLGAGKNVTTIRYCYSSVIKDLKEYYAVPWHKQKASLKQEYFNNPWSGISVLVASIFLVLTFIQTVCSILQLKQH